MRLRAQDRQASREELDLGDSRRRDRGSDPSRSSRRRILLRGSGLRVPTDLADLRNLEFAAARERKAREELHEEIRAAHKAGASLRQIAAIAGRSHESVRRLISQDQASGS